MLSVPILKRLYPSIVRRYLMAIGKVKHKININKFIFEIDIRESIERKTYFLKHYEKKRINYLLENSKKISSEILIDVGANIGFYSILLSNNFKNIYAFEPNYRNFQALLKNIKLNNLKNIKVFNFGLGQKKDKLKGSSNTKGELFQTSGFSISKDNKHGEEVLINLGDEVLKFEDKNITIKIDVEGFELFVLKGMKRILSSNNCLLQIEIWKKNKEEIYRFLDYLNYKMICTIDGDTYFINK